MSSVAYAKAAFRKQFLMTETVALRLQGYSQREIREELRERGYAVGKSSISNYLIAAKNEWKASRMEDMEEILQRELAKLDKMEADASKLFTKFDPDGNAYETFDSSKEANEWTKTRLRIMEQRHKLLGLYKPVKLDIESKNENVNVTEQTEATRATILSRLSSKLE
jgi:hypothetical protein